MQQQEIVQAIHTATADVFSTMLGIEIEALPTYVDRSSPSTADGIMSFVGLSGTWVGSGVISCTSHFACRVCSSFLMTEATAVDEEVLDAVGEISNMVIGNFKTAAETVVGPLSLSVPTVIYGRNFTSRSLGNNNWVVVPFKCGDDIFDIRIWFAPASESSATRHTGSHILQVI